MKNLTDMEKTIYNRIDFIIELINNNEYFTAKDLMLIMGFTSRDPIYKLVKEGKIKLCKNHNIINVFQPEHGILKYIFLKKNIIDFINTYYLFEKFKYEILDNIDITYAYLDTNQIYIENLNSDNFYSENLIDDYLFYENVKKVINELPEREREVLKLRFGLVDNKQRCLETVGEFFGVTKERIRQIEAKALRRIRSHYNENKEIKDLFDYIRY